MRWWRVLPVKFVGGMGTLGAGMVLGREGPMVQLGGNIGRMVLDVFRMRSPEARHTLLATGAASGLSAAFNAAGRYSVYHRRDAPAVPLQPDLH